MRTRICASIVLALAAACSCEDPAENAKGDAGDPARGEKLAMQRCLMCHRIEGKGAALGPPMDEALGKVMAFIPTYGGRAAKLQTITPNVYEKNRAAIQSVERESDPVRRYERWLDAYLQNPQFDDPANKMVPTPLTDSERADVVAWLATQRPGR